MSWKTARIVAGLLVASWCATVFADVYGIKNRSPTGYGAEQYEPPSILFRFADAGSSPTKVGYITDSVGTQLRADGLAWSASLGMWFFEPSAPSAPVSSTLRLLNPDTAVAGAGVTLPGRFIFGAAFDTRNRLWAADEASDELLCIDPNTGNVLYAVDLTYNSNTFNLRDQLGDIAFDALGNAWLVFEDDFYRVDTATGGMTLDRTVTGISLTMVGAAFSPVDADDLYVFDISAGWNNDDILRFDMDDEYARTNVALQIFTEFNAGRGDLASQMAPEPASLAVLTLGGLALIRRRKA